MAGDPPIRPTTGFELSAGRRYFSLGLLLLLSAFAFLNRSIIALMVQPIKADLGLSDFQIGLLQGFAFAVFYAFCAVPIGWALDRYPRRMIVYLGVTFWSVAAASCGLAQSYVLLLASRFGVGAGQSSLTPASYSILSEMFPKERVTTALAIFSLGASIGSALAMLGGGLVIDLAEQGVFRPVFGDTAPWRIVFMVTGLPGLALAFLIYLVPDTRKMSGAASRTEKPWRETLAFMRERRAFLTCHFLGFGLMAMLLFALTSWMPTYLIRNHGWTSGQAGAALAAMSLFSAAGVVLQGMFAEALLRRGVKDAHMRYYTWAAAGAGVLCILAFQMPSPWLTVLVAGLGGALCAMSGVSAGALQLVAPPQVRGLVSALYLLNIGLLGSGAGPVAVAAITDFVLKDENKVGQAISITFAIIAPIAVTCFFLGRKPMKAAILDSEAATA